MATQTLKNTNWERLRTALLIAAAGIFFVLFSFWSGVPGGEKALPFWIGVVVLVVVLAGFAFMTWHLLVRPLPAGQAVRVQTLPFATRQLLALLLGLGGVSIIVGLFWDEVWHRRYGVPFGEDFFWRPHLMMYFGFLSVTALAFISLYIISRSKGTFQQRFRANPIVGLLILLGAFLMYVLAADPIWHSIYGIDLTAWGIPHFVLISSFVLVLLMATAIHMTTQAPRTWSFRFRVADVLPLVMFATILLVWNQFWITEWDTGETYALRRPLWLLPVLIACGPAFVGTMANISLKRFGAATISGILALAIRSGLIALFGVQDIMFADAWILGIPVGIAVDVAFALPLPKSLPTLWRGTSNPLVSHDAPSSKWIFAGILAGLTMSVVTATIMKQFYPFTPLGILPLTTVMLIICCVATAWIGAQVGGTIANGSREAEYETAGVRWPLYSLGAVLVALVAMIFFVTTAVPPV